MCGIARGFFFCFFFLVCLFGAITTEVTSSLLIFFWFCYAFDWNLGQYLSFLCFRSSPPIFEAQKFRAEKVFRHTLTCKPLFWRVNLYENLWDANEWLNQNFGKQEYFMLYITFKTGGSTAVFLKEVLNGDILLKINFLFYPRKHLHFLRVEPDTQDCLSTQDGISSTRFLYF